MNKILQIVVMLAMQFCFLNQAEAGRLPKPKSATKSIQSYFHKYGKKYDETIFKDDAVEKVDVNAFQEVSYKVVYADALLYLKDGSVVRSLVKLKYKFPVGWKVISWEKI